MGPRRYGAHHRRHRRAGLARRPSSGRRARCPPPAADQPERHGRTGGRGPGRGAFRVGRRSERGAVRRGRPRSAGRGARRDSRRPPPQGRRAHGGHRRGRPGDHPHPGIHGTCHASQGRRGLEPARPHPGRGPDGVRDVLLVRRTHPGGGTGRLRRRQRLPRRSRPEPPGHRTARHLARVRHLGPARRPHRPAHRRRSQPHPFPGRARDQDASGFLPVRPGPDHRARSPGTARPQHRRPAHPAAGSLDRRRHRTPAPVATGHPVRAPRGASSGRRPRGGGGGRPRHRRSRGAAGRAARAQGPRDPAGPRPQPRRVGAWTCLGRPHRPRPGFPGTRLRLADRAGTQEPTQDSQRSPAADHRRLRLSQRPEPRRPPHGGTAGRPRGHRRTRHGAGVRRRGDRRRRTDRHRRHRLPLPGRRHRSRRPVAHGRRGHRRHLRVPGRPRLGGRAALRPGPGRAPQQLRQARRIPARRRRVRPGLLRHQPA